MSRGVGEVWNGECGMGSVEGGVRNGECGMGSVEWGVWNGECGMGGVEWGGWDGGCGRGGGGWGVGEGGMGSAEWGVDSTTVTTDIDGLFSGVLPGLKAHGWVGARAPFPSLAGLAAPAQLALLCPDFLVLNWVACHSDHRNGGARIAMEVRAQRLRCLRGLAYCSYCSYCSFRIFY